LAGQNEARNVKCRVAIPMRQQKKITAAKTKNNCKSDLGFDAAID
jgi:hypothetical protein